MLGTDIAIVGMAGRFPGANTVDELWCNVRDGAESITFFTADDLRISGVDKKLLEDPDYVRAAALMDDPDQFDASFFGYTARDAKLMDPQHRILLECAWEAMENAGYGPGTIERPVGVFAGATINTYLLLNLASNPDLMNALDPVQINVTNGADFLTTRISYKLDLKGPSHLVQSACSTSLVAVHIACQSLLNEECDMALAGGVSINQKLARGYRFVEGGIASPDGRCRAFDARAQGTLFGSGVGLVVLKRLKDALADGDCIRAVIKGSAINNDGALKVGYTAPGVEGQASVIAEAHANAGVTAETITYVETHGTGTTLGDPVEVQALTRAFRATTPRKGFCAIGSIKTNIGHLDAAAGVTSLIKTVLALENRALPPSLHFEQPNPNVDFAGSPFYVNSKLSEWVGNGSELRAGVSSFGVGGTNAHVVLEEAPPRPTSSESRPHKLMVLSAKTHTALKSVAGNLLEYLIEHPNANLEDLAYTLQVGRTPFGQRRMFVCRTVVDAVRQLESSDQAAVGALSEFSRPTDAVPGKLIDQRPHSIARPPRREAAEQPVVFMFPGQVAQYVNMGLGLYQVEPDFRELIDACSELLVPHLGIDLRETLYPRRGKAEQAQARLNQTWIAQPTLFAIEYSLARLWMQWGVLPQAMIGHSLGEYVAACLAGVFSLEDGLALVAARGRMMQPLSGGGMMAVPLSEREAQCWLGNNISLAAVNGPSQSVLSGPNTSLSALAERLTREGVACRLLPTDYAFHSAMMDSVIDPFIELVERIPRQQAQIPYISSLTGTWITEQDIESAAYWATHLRGTVRFAAGMQHLLSETESLFLEVGPGHALSRLVRQQPDFKSSQPVLASLPRPEHSTPETVFILETLGQLWVEGARVDWTGFHAHEKRNRLPLPTYPFERQRYWIEPGQPLPRGAPKAYEDKRSESVAESLPGPQRESPASVRHPRPNLQTAFVAPSTELERAVAQIWKQVLGIESVGLEDNFFDLGGDSLIATEAMGQLKRELGLEIPVVGLYEGANIKSLIALMQEQNGAELIQPSTSPPGATDKRVSRRKRYNEHQLLRRQSSRD
jgi:acyl transferase domain-containing protein